MKSHLLVAVCACLAFVSFNANAALVSRLGGLAYYDDVADLTWLADANAAGTTMNWDTAKSWAAGLDIAGVTGWRLPDTLQPDSSCSSQSEGTSWGANCSGSEMGNLFYNVLGGSVGSSITTSHNANYDLFSNVQSSRYWSATVYAPSRTSRWTFSMADGGQYSKGYIDSWYAWAVHSGDVALVPLPAAFWLFGSGLIGLISVAKRKARA